MKIKSALIIQNLFIAISCIISYQSFSQATISPAPFDQNTSITLRFDAATADPDGTAGLVGASKVYMHAGAMINNPRSEDWTYVVGNWGADDNVGLMNNIGGDIWELTFTPATYFGISGGDNIYRIGVVFRSADGNDVGKNQDGSGNIYFRVSGAVQDRAVDSLSLVDLYNYTNGGTWTNSTNWNVTPMDTWNGITVTTGRVNAINLSSNNITGTLPQSLGDMDALTSLDLSINQLNGAVPPSFTMLSSLTELYLNDNLLAGLPDFTSLGALTTLGVANNYFDFSDLEPNTGQSYSISYISQFEYGPDQLRGLFPGETVVLSTSPGGTSNFYQWFKDGIILTDSISQTLTVSSADIITESIFHCEVTNSLVSGLTLTSAPAIVRTSSSTNSIDSLALVALYNSTNGNNWNNNENWLTGPVDVWAGVTVNAGRVELLQLNNNNLSGEIPFQIGDLTSLTVLALGQNNLSGALPAEIGNLTNLTTLHLYVNQLSGELPTTLGNLINLIDLDLAPNQFSGIIPTEIGNLVNLQTLWLNHNQFSGDVPVSFANLLNLKNLYLMNNQLIGLPDLSGITGFDVFQIENNNFTFEDLEANAGVTATTTLSLFPQNLIPLGGTAILQTGAALNLDATIGGSVNNYEWFKNDISIGITTPTYNVPSVSAIDEGVYLAKVTSSFFPGDTIFTEATAVYVASNMRMADSLALVEMYNTMGGPQWNNQNNWLSGTLDTWNGIILNGDRVYEIILNANNLSGSLTSSIGNLDSIHNINLGDNSISGEIPPELYGLTSLNFLYMFNNSLTGDLSPDFGNLINLRHLFVNGNTLTGTIPATFQNLASIELLGLSSNLLSGNLPIEIYNLTTLTALYLDLNQFTGSISADITKLVNLEEIALEENNFSGTFPDLTGLDNLRVFRANNNNFSGVFPSQIWQSTIVEWINLGYNSQLEVVLPADMSTLTNLHTLNISGTQPIRGAFPAQLFNITSLVDLNLGGHYFTGTLGPEIGNMVNLEWLWIWNNLLEGDFPAEILNLTNLRGIGIAGYNKFTSFPDISGLPNLQDVDLAYNDLGFKDLLPYASLSLDNFRYAPQNRRDGEYLTVTENGGLTLTNPYNGAGNEYLWVFNTDTLVSETNKDLTISNAGLANLGSYYCNITNPSLPELQLASSFYNVAFDGAPKAFYVDNRPGALTDFTSFYAGFYGTNDGDTLYVAGSDIPYDIGGIRLEIPKVIIGPGYFLDSNSETQHNTPSANIQQYLHIAPGAEGSVIYGMELNGYRVDVHNVTSTTPTSVGNIKLIGNKINQLNFSHSSSNIELAGNYINLLFFNSTSLDRTLWRTYDDFNIHNNIIDSVGTIFARISTEHNNLTNMLFENNTIGYISDSIQNVALTSNIIGVNNSVGSTEISNLVGDYSAGVFVNGSGTFGIDNDFNLSASSTAIGAGAGGTNAGHTGGVSPYVLSGLPPVPNIYFIDPLARVRFSLNAKQNENTVSPIEKINYWINDAGTAIDKGELTLENSTTSASTTFRPKLSKVTPGGTYELYLQAKAQDGSKGPFQYIPFTATTVNASGSITTSAGANVDAGEVYLFEINAEGTAFDTLTTTLSAGNFAFNNIVEGDYLAMAFADTVQYPNELPTYYLRTNFWEESDTLLIDQSFPSFGIQLIAEPPVTVGTGEISGVVEEEFDENSGGRIEAKRKVAGAGVSVRRRAKQGKTEAEEFILVEYVYTNENGEFHFDKLEDEEYFINIQYPGYPMDETSDISILLGDGGGDYAEVVALVDNGKITVTILEITGLFDAHEANPIEVYPNPSSEIVNINVPEGEIYSIQLVDAQGREMINKTLDFDDNKFDFSNLSDGIYIIKIKSEDTIINLSRIVKRTE